jgi:hypothetical protein
VAKVRDHDPSELAITVLTVEEQLSGWYTEVRKAKRPERLARAYRELARTIRFLSRLRIVDYDEAAIERYERLRKQKVKLRRMDLRIASCVFDASSGSSGHAQRSRFWTSARTANRGLGAVSEPAMPFELVPTAVVAADTLVWLAGQPTHQTRNTGM